MPRLLLVSPQQLASCLMALPMTAGNIEGVIEDVMESGIDKAYLQQPEVQALVSSLCSAIAQEIEHFREVGEPAALCLFPLQPIAR